MSDSRHWAAQGERGSLILMKFTAWAIRRLGRRLLSPLIYGIVLYFFLFGGKARRATSQYQTYLAQWSGQARLQPNRRRLFRQYLSFADALLDKLDAWNGKLRLEQIDIQDPSGLRQRMRGPRGELLVGAHLGNLEVCRALAELGEKVQMNVLVHTRHAERFNRLLGEAGATHLRLIQVSELDPAVMLQLSQRLERGEWLAIAGDRIPLHGGRHAEVDFLGHRALLPQGPWLLAGLLKCPVNLIFCLKGERGYRVLLEPFATAIEWRRSDRAEVITHAAQRYADRLAHHCLEAPWQWYNFYPFWKTDDKPSI